MKRREFITAVGGAAATWPLAVRAQQSVMPVVGFLHGGLADGFTREAASFRKGLSEVGRVVGRNIEIEYRWAEGHYDRLPEMALDLVRRKVAVIAAAPTAPALAAKAATDTIPIVFELGVDPVAAGLVTSISRPSGNVTGIVNLSAALVGKRIEVMHQLVPDAKFIAMLVNPDNGPTFNTETVEAQAAQTPLGVQIQFLHATTGNEIEAAYAKAAKIRAGAIVVSSDPFFISKRADIAALASRYRLPTIHIYRSFAADGGLISYGADLVDAYRLTGVYAGRIVNGEKPTDLPVQQSTKVEMTINLKAAKALGLTVPLPLLGRADEVIE